MFLGPKYGIGGVWGGSKFLTKIRNFAMSTACASHGVAHERAFSPWKLKKLDLWTKKKKKSPNYFLMKDPWGKKFFTVRPDYFENRILRKNQDFNAILRWKFFAKCDKTFFQSFLLQLDLRQKRWKIPKTTFSSWTQRARKRQNRIE